MVGGILWSFDLITKRQEAFFSKGVCLPYLDEFWVVFPYLIGVRRGHLSMTNLQKEEEDHQDIPELDFGEGALINIFPTNRHQQALVTGIERKNYETHYILQIWNLAERRVEAKTKISIILEKSHSVGLLGPCVWFQEACENQSRKEVTLFDLATLTLIPDCENLEKALQEGEWRVAQNEDSLVMKIFRQKMDFTLQEVRSDMNLFTYKTNQQKERNTKFTSSELTSK